MTFQHGGEEERFGSALWKVMIYTMEGNDIPSMEGRPCHSLLLTMLLQCQLLYLNMILIYYLCRLTLKLYHLLSQFLSSRCIIDSKKDFHNNMVPPNFASAIFYIALTTKAFEHDDDDVW